MFAIASPQTFVLTVPGEDAQPVSLTFHTGTKEAPDDTSSCVIDVLMPNGDVHVVTFGTAGKLVDVQFVAHREPDEVVEVEREVDIVVDPQPVPEPVPQP